MRIRATVAALSGALALSALVLPSAQADTQALPVVSNVTINSGKSVVVGTTVAKTFTVSLTASHASGIEDAFVHLWHGTNADTDVDGLLLPNEDAATCTASSATTSTCKLTITAVPGEDLYANALAGGWHVTAAVVAGDGELYWNDEYKTHKVQRASKLTVNASPEPIAKGKTLTVTGKLSRASWESLTYKGYGSQSVKLQFRKAGTTTYSTVKTITSNSYGDLKTTTTANYDGYWRFRFEGTSTTPAVSATGDYVDVQ
ncbi:DUF5707 domain-containing protein [Streptomyces cavernae]|uniref:DUF5707 domain-containing protein n=1 Tax=Streptomyces cavernae TaxID=2259034 RepID=UPI000FEBFE32|nr:DUF5707 domain-containing protein [Streptomyces cavernae]